MLIISIPLICFARIGGNKMSLSKREKILLLILFVVIIFYIYFNYLYTPKYEELLALREKYEENSVLEKRTENALKNSDEIGRILENIKIKYNQLETTLPSAVHQEEIIILIKGIMDNNSINLKTVGYSVEKKDDTNKDEGVTVSEMIDNYERFLEGESNIDLSSSLNISKQKDEEEQNPEGEENISKSVKYMDVNISFTGKYDNLKAALIDIEQSARKIIIKSISLAEAENEVVGNLAIAFPYYELEKRKQIENWPFNDIYGNTQPFAIPNDYKFKLSTDKENTVEDLNEENEKNISTESDFYIILKPFISDLPTVSIGKYPYRYSEIYVKSQAPEKVSIFIKEENDKYYYRYENSMDSYPKGNDTWEEFTPYKDNLVLSILSMKRLNQKDQSGIILNINNSTKKQLNLKIYNDDPNNPRVKIDTQNGLIRVEGLQS